jgi:HSP20 family protein
MFKIFSFGLGDSLNNLGKIGGMVESFINNIDINEIAKNIGDTLSDEYHKKEETQSDFIELQQDDDMYLLIIDLKGINMREVSIKYDVGIIEINLSRLEMEKRGIGILSNNVLVKKLYNKTFRNIEEIDTSQILKGVDNGILSIRMPKKYTIESISHVIDVDSYEDYVDNYKNS